MHTNIKAMSSSWPASPSDILIERPLDPSVLHELSSRLPEDCPPRSAHKLAVHISGRYGDHYDLISRSIHIKRPELRLTLFKAPANKNKRTNYELNQQRLMQMVRNYNERHQLRSCDFDPVTNELVLYDSMSVSFRDFLQKDLLEDLDVEVRPTLRSAYLLSDLPELVRSLYARSLDIYLKEIRAAFEYTLLADTLGCRKKIAPIVLFLVKGIASYFTEESYYQVTHTAPGSRNTIRMIKGINDQFIRINHTVERKQLTDLRALLSSYDMVPTLIPFFYISQERYIRKAPEELLIHHVLAHDHYALPKLFLIVRTLQHELDRFFGGRTLGNGILRFEELFQQHLGMSYQHFIKDVVDPRSRKKPRTTKRT